MIDENDDSDLIYDKELKGLLEDHKIITRLIMIVSMLVMTCQSAFGILCMMELSELGSWEDALLINWFHVLKIFMNTYISWTFFKRITAEQPSSPLGYLSSYLTLFLYLAMMFIHADLLAPNIPRSQLNILTLYAASDIMLMVFSWSIQTNLVRRRDELFKFKAGGIAQEKKEYDLFDIRYLPEEYISDIEDSSDEEDDEPQAPVTLVVQDPNQPQNATENAAKPDSAQSNQDAPPAQPDQTRV